jgi:hypothetical protein
MLVIPYILLVSVATLTTFSEATFFFTIKCKCVVTLYRIYIRKLISIQNVFHYQHRYFYLSLYSYA